MKPADLAALKAALLVVRHGNGVPVQEIMGAVCTPERIQELLDTRERMLAMLFVLEQSGVDLSLSIEKTRGVRFE